MGRKIDLSRRTAPRERNAKTGWRRGWDSNPRDPFGPNGFQDRRSQPLSYPSWFDCSLLADSTAFGVAQSLPNSLSRRLGCALCFARFIAESVNAVDADA